MVISKNTTPSATRTVIAGYIMALLIFFVSASAFSLYTASRCITTSSTPPVSPANTRR